MPTTRTPDLASTIAQAKDDITESAEQVAAAAVQNASQLSDWWHCQTGVAHEATQAAAELSEATRNYIRNQPMKSLLTAAATGAVVAGLAFLAMKRRRP